MKYAIKNKKKIVEAYQLGVGNPMEEKLIETGAIRRTEEGDYELFSLEAVAGFDGGQIAKAGDYFKTEYIDGVYYPYPNEKEWFEQRHTHISGDEYEQKNEPLAIWEYNDPMTEEIQFLLEEKRLILRPEEEEHYFNAVLWGSKLSAPIDAVIIFYGVTYDESGAIREVDFNFIQREIFEETYSYCE